MVNLQARLVGEVEVSSGSLLIFNPDDGKDWWFRDIKDKINVYALNDKVVQCNDMVLANMLAESYSVFVVEKKEEMYIVEKAPLFQAVEKNALEIYDSVIACADNTKVPWDVRPRDKSVVLKLPQGRYDITLGENPRILRIISSKSD